VFKEQSSDKINEVKCILVEGLSNLHQSYASEKKRSQSNLPIAHTLLILQHFLMLHGEKLSTQEVFEIYKLCKSFLPEDINEP
jgi:hypothetical protein